MNIALHELRDGLSSLVYAWHRAEKRAAEATVAYERLQATAAEAANRAEVEGRIGSDEWARTHDSLNAARRRACSFAEGSADEVCRFLLEDCELVPCTIHLRAPSDLADWENGLYTSPRQCFDLDARFRDLQERQDGVLVHATRLGSRIGVLRCRTAEYSALCWVDGPTWQTSWRADAILEEGLRASGLGAAVGELRQMTRLAPREEERSGASARVAGGFVSGLSARGAAEVAHLTSRARQARVAGHARLLVQRWRTYVPSDRPGLFESAAGSRSLFMGRPPIDLPIDLAGPVDHVHAWLEANARRNPDVLDDDAQSLSESDDGFGVLSSAGSGTSGWGEGLLNVAGSGSDVDSDDMS